MGTVVCDGGVFTGGVGVVNILVCDTNMTSYILLKMQPRLFEDWGIEKRGTNETPTCAVLMHTPQTKSLW